MQVTLVIQQLKQKKKKNIQMFGLILDDSKRICLLNYCTVEDFKCVQLQVYSRSQLLTIPANHDWNAICMHFLALRFVFQVSKLEFGKKRWEDLSNVTKIGSSFINSIFHLSICSQTKELKKRLILNCQYNCCTCKLMGYSRQTLESMSTWRYWMYPLKWLYHKKHNSYLLIFCVFSRDCSSNILQK